MSKESPELLAGMGQVFSVWMLVHGHMLAPVRAPSSRPNFRALVAGFRLLSDKLVYHIQVMKRGNFSD